VGAGAGLDVLEKRWLCCCSQDLNPRSSAVYPSHCTECAALYWFGDITKLCISTVR
jgi:hypothetical protein